MKSIQRIRLEHEDSGIRFLRLEDSERQNPLDDQFCSELQTIVDQLKMDLDAKVVVITGLKDIFSSGGSHEFIQSLKEHYKGHVEHEYGNYLKVLLDIPIPVIAAMEGSATGGGLALAFYSDIIIAAEESRYGFSYMNMGFTPGMGTTALALESLGQHKGFEMMVSGEYLKGRELKGNSNFNYILPRDEILDKAQALAEAIAEKPRVSLELLKKYTSIRKRKLVEETHTIEAFMHKISFTQPEIQQYIEDNYPR